VPRLALQPGPLLGPVVRLVAKHPRATLQVQTELAWNDLCSVPCGLRADPARLYRVAGRRLVPSEPFNLPRGSGDVTIRADMSSRTRRIVGVVLLPAGAAYAALGGLLLLSYENHPAGDAGPIGLIGIMGIVAGAGMLIASAVLLGGSSSTVDVR